MLYMMMNILPILLILALAAGILLLVGIGFGFIVREFRQIGRHPEKYVPCPDTLPCLDRDPREVKSQRA